MSFVAGVAHDDPGNEWRMANVASLTKEEEAMQVLWQSILSSSRQARDMGCMGDGEKFEKVVGRWETLRYFSLWLWK